MFALGFIGLFFMFVIVFIVDKIVDKLAPDPYFNHTLILLKTKEEIAKMKKKHDKYKKIGLVIGTIVLLIIMMLIGSLSNEGSSTSNSGKLSCPICDRYFDSSSSNGKSIKRNGMCSNCYKNFKYLNEDAMYRVDGVSANAICDYLHKIYNCTLCLSEVDKNE